MTKAITIGGQRVSVEQFSDVYRDIIIAMALQAEDDVLNLGQLSSIIEAAVELFAEGLPARLYKQKKTKYFWVGSSDELREFLNGLYRVYWEYELDNAKEVKDQTRINLATQQINAVDAILKNEAQKNLVPEISAELEAELAQIRNDYAVIAQ
jgi:hypothetical protein